MKIRHATQTDEGTAVENTFVAYDDLENCLGEADVSEYMRDMLCPSRPHHLKVRVDCEEEAMDALLGAATARAMLLARGNAAAARIYAQCGAEDTLFMRALTAQGYKDDDALIRMRRPLRRGPIVKPLPAGCVIVRDYLIDETESRFFLERHNAVFAENRDMAYLRELKQKPNFARLLAVAPGGLAGELITWSDGAAGVVGVVETPPAWQKKGVASYLMEQARMYWLSKGLSTAYFDVWTRLTGAMRLAATSGFRPAEVICRYPGIDYQ